MNNLDFSKFPKIVPENNGENTQVLSKLADNVKSLTVSLLNALEEYNSQIVSVDNKRKLLEDLEKSLNDRELDINEKETKVYTLEDKLKQEKEYIARMNKDLKEKELKNESDKKYLDEIKKEKETLEEKKAELIIQETKTKEEIKILSTLKEKEKLIEDRESVVAKSEAVDAERKRMLDIREDRIKNREHQLQIEQEE